MRYCFDLDGTICDTPCDPDGNNKRYWEVYLNPWLHQVIFVLYDRWYSIKKGED